METTRGYENGHAGNGLSGNGHYDNVAPLPDDAVEARLELNRARLRHRLLQDEARDQNGVWQHINDVTREVAPVARAYIRSKPALSLAAAAAAGALMVRFKPWRALGGPILLGMVARQIAAATMTRGSAFLGSLMTGTGRHRSDRYTDPT